MYHLFEKQCFVVILLFLLEIRSAAKNECPLQHSTVLNNSQEVVWNSTGAANEIIISIPPCIDENKKILTRICLNGTWLPENPPTCYKISHRHCPENMKETPEKCVFISQPRAWGEKCTFTGKAGNVSFKKELTWLPVKRKVKYGPYESVIWGKDYGHPMDDSYKILLDKEDLFTKDCLATNSKDDGMLPVHCTDKHVSVCPVNDDDENCPKECVSAGILTQQCFCKKSHCKNLAQIKSMSDKKKLSKLVQEDNCKVGDSFITNLTHLGFTQSLKGNIWFLTQEPMTCSLCLVQQEKAIERVEMTLEFDVKKTDLTLTIYLSNSFPEYAKDESSIYCFTDASKELKKRVKIKHFHTNREKTNALLYFNVELEKYIGHYWCEAYRRGAEKLVFSNKILAYRKKSGNEYSLRLKINETCKLFNCSLTGGGLDYSQFVDEDNFRVLKHKVAEIRAMEVFYFNFITLDILLHLTTKKSNDPENEMNDLKNVIKDLHRNIEVIYFRNSELCLSETNEELTWPRTKIGDVAVPKNPCLSLSGLPILRACSGDFMYGSQWSNVSGICHDNNLSESTRYMYSMFQKNLSSSYLSEISRFTEKEELTVLGHYFLTKVMRKISDYEFSNTETFDVIANTFRITNNLMKMKSETLVEAQKLLNVTDEIIDAIEDFTSKWNDSNDFLLVNQNIILHVADPFSTNTTGMLMYNKDNKITVENFKQGYSYEKIANKENLQFAYYLPDMFLNDIPEEHRDDVHIVSTIFLKSQLFPTSNTNLSGPIVSIIIQGLDYLPAAIPVWFRMSDEQENPRCAFWDYGKKTIRHKGNWSQIGGKYMGKISNNSSMHVCYFSHLTHFALLVSNAQINPDSTNDFILNIISISGDSLSLIGIVGIIATALFFKNWRRKPGTKILLNLSIAISLEIIAVFLIQIGVVNSDFHCQIVGPIVHYLLLCKFFWMLIYAFLQYNRFVKVLDAIPQNIVLKSVIFGWGFAIIPVIIVIILNPNTYSINKYNFCYTNSISLYLSLYTPILLVISLNTVVFFIVMRNISSTMAESYVNKMDNRTQKLQLKLATLLFFVLGLPFLLGIFSNIVELRWLQITMIYIYSITSNIQGFILFLFYVILNKETRQDWIKYYNKTTDKSASKTTSTKNKSSNS